MLKHKDHFHGSDLEQIERLYDIKKSDIISFSANVNPLGISYQLRQTLTEQLDAITQYPDRDYKKLRKCIAGYVSTAVDNVIVGNGSTELISLFIRTQQPKKALVLGPTYSEYEREVALGGGITKYYQLKSEDDFVLDIEDFCKALKDSTDLLVLCNPNNPTSIALNTAELRKILDTCALHNIFVMIDETYVEFTENVADITAIPLTSHYHNLIILRGTSKFFAAPGLRLGYAITGNTELVRAIDDLKNPWSINSLAEIAGRLMLTDHEYIEKTRQLISNERKRLVAELSSWESIKVYPPQANFILLKILKNDVNAQSLFEHCIRQGLMIRNCSSFPFLDNSYVRFCIMNPEQNDKLLDAFREILC